MKTVGRLVARKTSRITDRTVVTHLARIVLAALAPVLVLAVTACASESEPAAPQAAPVAPEPAVAAAPAQKAAPGSGEAALAPRSPAPAPTAHAAAQDSSQAVKAAKVAQTKTILERDAPVREASQQSNSQPTEKAAQAAPAPTAAPQTSGGQLTASDVQKAMNSSAAAAQAAPPGQRGPVVKQAAAAGGPISRPAPVTPPSATTFRDYERSRFASTSEDSVSTFSLDTDRTSFQLALNWARSGHAVDPDSVRAEEWINAFDYGYEPPAHRDSFAITTDVFTHPWTAACTSCVWASRRLSFRTTPR